MYENIFVCYQAHKDCFERADIVATLLKAAGADGLTCKDIGIAIYGDRYTKEARERDWEAARYPAKLGSVLKALRRAGHVTMEKKPGEPIDVTYEKYVIEDNNGEPEYLDVVDAKGNHYQMPNPRFNRYNRHGEYRTVTEQVTPMITVWKWVKD